jgi:hypothetical protein
MSQRHDSKSDMQVAYENCSEFGALLAGRPSSAATQALQEFLDTRLFPDHGIIQWEVFAKDLEEEASSRRPSYIVGSAHRKVPSVVSPSLHDQLSTKGWAKYFQLAGIEDSHEQALPQRKSSDFLRMLATGILSFNRGAYDELFEAFAASQAHRSAPALLIDDGEHTFFAMLWLLRRRPPGAESGDAQREFVVFSYADSESFSSSSLDEFLLDLGLGVRSRLDRSVFVPTHRWRSLIRWLGVVHETAKTLVEHVGRDLEGDAWHHHLPIKSCSFGARQRELARELALSLASDALGEFAARSRSLIAKPNATVPASAICELSSALGTVAAAQAVSLPGELDPIHQLCRNPYLPAEYCFRAAQPFGMDLLVVPLNCRMGGDQKVLIPSILAFTTIVHSSVDDAIELPDGIQVKNPGVASCWQVASMLAREVAVDILNEKAEDAGRQKGRGSILHQLPKDLKRIEYDINEANKAGRKLAKLLADKGIEEKVPVVRTPIALSVAVALVEAQNHGRLFELPWLTARRLYTTWNTPSITAFVDEVVWYAAEQRVRQADKWRAYEVLALGGRGNFEQLQALLKKPPIVINKPFDLGDKQEARGIYPLVLFALRNAVHHAVLGTIDDDGHTTGRESRVVIRKEETPEYMQVVIENSGEPPRADACQGGWERDLSGFAKVDLKWFVVTRPPGIYSDYHAESGMWRTILRRIHNG